MWYLVLREKIEKFKTHPKTRFNTHLKIGTKTNIITLSNIGTSSKLVDSLTLKCEITVKLNNLVHHPFPLAPPNITAQSLPPSFITTEIIYKHDRLKKRHFDTSHSITHIQYYPTHIFLNKLSPSNPPSFYFFRTNKS